MDLQLSKISLAFKFEFILTNKLDITQLKQQLAAYIKSPIKVYDNVNINIDTPKSGTYKMLHHNIDGFITVLYTPPLKIVKAKSKLKQIYSFIQKYGKTDWMCNVSVRYIFDDNFYSIDYLTHIIPLKFAMLFDEQIVWKLFPSRRFTPFYLGLNRLRPMYIDKPVNITHSQFAFLKHNNLYVDFKDRLNNEITMNYIGGDNYENKYEQSVELIEMFLQTINKVVHTKILDIDIQKKYKQKLTIVRNLIQSAKEYDTFLKRFPNINLTYNLSKRRDMVSVFISMFGEIVGWKLLETNVRSGYINYDSDIDKLQFKGLDLKNGGLFIKDDIISSNISKTVFDDCYIRNCTLDNCLLINCIVENCKISNTKITNSLLNKGTNLSMCYVTGKTVLDNTTIKSSYLNQVQLYGYKINKSSKIDKNTTIIELLDYDVKPVYR